MINKQMFVRHDSLREFKESAQKTFPNCAFYSDKANGVVNIGAGFLNGNSVTERIVTDGTISLQRKNQDSPHIVWENHLYTLENGTSISIEIEKASFMIDVVSYLGQEQVDIHVEQEDKNFLQRILNYFYERQVGLYDTHSITFTSPTILLLESIVDGKRKTETLDFASSSTTTSKKYHKKRK